MRDIVNHDKSFVSAPRSAAPYVMDLRQRIAHALKRSGLTQESFGQSVANVGQTAVANWINGKKPNEPSLATLSNMGRVSKLAAAWIAFGDEYLSQQEAELVGAFREMTPERQRTVLSVANGFVGLPEGPMPEQASEPARPLPQRR